jgi:hypothetical protein
LGPHEREAMNKRLAAESIPEDCIYSYVDAVINGEEEGDDTVLVITRFIGKSLNSSTWNMCLKYFCALISSST